VGKIGVITIGGGENEQSLVSVSKIRSNKIIIRRKGKLIFNLELKFYDLKNFEFNCSEILTGLLST
jgi:hypothetical protein